VAVDVGRDFADGLVQEDFDSRIRGVGAAWNEECSSASGEHAADKGSASDFFHVLLVLQLEVKADRGE